MPKWAQLEAVRVGKGLQGKLTRTIQSHGGCYQPACSGADVHQQSAALPAHRWAHGALDPDDAKQVDFEQLLKLLNCVAFGQTHRRDVMTEGLFAAPACKGYGKTMVDQAYDRVGSPVTVGLKDANLIQAAADLARVPLPSFNVYRDRLLGAIAHGDGDKDQAVLAREQARACGLQ